MILALRDLLARLQEQIVWTGGSSTERGKASVSVPQKEYAAFLSVHNGLVGFQGALRVFGLSDGELPSVFSWNDSQKWRTEYRGLDEGLFFFAEDAFGNQFAFCEGRVVRFLAETGDREDVAGSFVDWLQRTLDDPGDELSEWLVAEWVATHGPIQADQHLCPKVPFVAEGAFEVDNLYTCDRYESMRFKGNIADQIRNLPTGTKIRFKVT